MFNVPRLAASPTMFRIPRLGVIPILFVLVCEWVYMFLYIRWAASPIMMLVEIGRMGWKWSLGDGRTFFVQFTCFLPDLNYRVLWISLYASYIFPALPWICFLERYLIFIFFLKGTVSLISSNPLCIDGYARFKTVPLETCWTKMIDSDKSRMFSYIRNFVENIQLRIYFLKF